MTLSLPAGSSAFSGFGADVDFDDLTSGQTGSAYNGWFSDGVSTSNGGTTVTADLPIDVAPGDRVTVTFQQWTSATTTGAQTATFQTSSDSGPVSLAYTLTSGHQPVAGFAALTGTTPAAGATGVTYQATFTASATGGLANGYGTITLGLPAGTVIPAGYSVSDDIKDLTTGQDGSPYSPSTSDNGATVTLTVPFAIGAGDTVQVTIPNVQNTTTPGPHSVALSTSSDAQPVTTALTVTPASAPASFTDLSLSSTQGGAGDVTGQFTFTASKTGGLANSSGTVTLTLAPGTTFTTGEFEWVEFDDLTNGQDNTTDELSTSSAGNALTMTVPFGIQAGDRVTVTIPGITNPPSGGALSATLQTSSDTVPASLGYSVGASSIVAAPGVALSTQGAGLTATYQVSFTTSPTGALAAGSGAVILAAPAGTVFSDSATYTGRDITAGKQITFADEGTSNSGATIRLSPDVPVNGGDQVTLSAPGVTNATSTGANILNISTTSDSVPAPAPFNLGDSLPVFTADTPPLVVAPGSKQQYTFAAAGYPAFSYSLTGAPGWLSIDSATGQLTGTVPAGTTSFTYSVQVTNSGCTAIEGPYTVTVVATATVSGKVVTAAGAPVAAAEVDACETTGATCESAITDDAWRVQHRRQRGRRRHRRADRLPAARLRRRRDLLRPADRPVRRPVRPDAHRRGGHPPAALRHPAQRDHVADRPEQRTVHGDRLGLRGWLRLGLRHRPGPLHRRLQRQHLHAGGEPGRVGPVHRARSAGRARPRPGRASTSRSPASRRGRSCRSASFHRRDRRARVRRRLHPRDGGALRRDGREELHRRVRPGDPGRRPRRDGTVPVTVTVGGTTVSACSYTYMSITSISPASGPAAGGTAVVIKGTGLSDASQVLFGTQGTQFTQVSATEIDAVSPPGTGTQAHHRHDAVGPGHPGDDGRPVQLPGGHRERGRRPRAAEQRRRGPPAGPDTGGGQDSPRGRFRRRGRQRH